MWMVSVAVPPEAGSVTPSFLCAVCGVAFVGDSALPEANPTHTALARWLGSESAAVSTTRALDKM